MQLNEFVRQHDILAHEPPLFNIPDRKEYVLKHIGRGKRVLDLGCLGGKFSQLIQKQNNEVFGIEMNERAVALATSRGIQVKNFDLNEGIPFPDQHFDVVHAGKVIEQIYDSKYLMEEVNRVLKPGGTFLFLTANLNSMENRIRVFTGSYPSQIGAYPDDNDGVQFRAFNLGKIRELCEHTGFQVMRVLGLASASGKSLKYRLMRPVVRVLPQLGEHLLVRARKAD